MRIVHVAPFAPGRCGLYESVRDLMRGEQLLGHDVVLVDSGVVGEGSHYGARDGHVLAEPPGAALGADVLVTHTSPPDEVVRLARDVPRVHVIHGRPESSFRLSQKGGPSPVYDIYARWARDRVVDKWVTMWPEHLPYWSVLLPEDRLVSTSAPPCDLDRWSPDGPKHEWSPAGDQNVLVADTWRDDADPYHVVHGLILLAKRRPGLKVHVYAMQTPLGPWEHLLAALRKVGALGETKGMMRDIASRYRAADVVVTPHRIATRVVREAAACGATVVTGEPCDEQGGGVNWGSVGCDPQDPRDVARAVGIALAFPRAPDVTRYDCARIANELVGHINSVRSSALAGRA